MGRTVVRQVERPRQRQGGGGNILLVAIGVVLILALIGLVSTGIFVAGKVSASPHAAKSHHPGTGSRVAVADLARAQAQATAIVKAANDASTSIVHTATKRAHQQAAGIIAAAQRRARQIQAQPAATPVPVAPVAPVAPVTPPSGTQQTTLPPTTANPGTSGSTGSAFGVTTPPGGAASAPNLRGVPASWLVVGYNASFGSGPGSAGSISVVNRGNKVFSGVAVVQYTRGGSASAPFAGLAPGQSLVLPLNGARYLGGGYRILVNVH